MYNRFSYESELANKVFVADMLPFLDGLMYKYIGKYNVEESLIREILIDVFMKYRDIQHKKSKEFAKYVLLIDGLIKSE